MTASGRLTVENAQLGGLSAQLAGLSAQLGVLSGGLAGGSGGLARNASSRAGLLAAEQARAVLREPDELHSISQVLRGELSGTLRIGCSPPSRPGSCRASSPISRTGTPVCGSRCWKPRPMCWSSAFRTGTSTSA